MISPFPKAAVCNVGNRLEVFCNSTESSLRWRITFIGTNDHVERTMTSNTIFQEIVVVDTTVFNFSRTSERGNLPLLSTLVIRSVSQTLNSSTITCMESSTTLPVAPMATTTIHIMRENDGRFLANNIMLIML